jgi:hypothetical protein
MEEKNLIPYKEGFEVIKSLSSKFRFGSSQIESKINGDYEWIDIYSEDLGLGARSKIAEEIAKEFGLKVMVQDFGPGEGISQIKWEVVFVAHCKTLEELRTASERIEKACKELETKLIK